MNARAILTVRLMIPMEVMMMSNQLSLQFLPVKIERCGDAEGGEYQTVDRRFYVRLELAGQSHGAVTLIDRVGNAFQDTFGKPASQICRCGGLASARVLIETARQQRGV